MERSRRNHAAAALAILAAAAWIRLPALRTEPWLDEIWSIMFARAAKSVGDVLFGLHHDNNHPLNTLWLYWTSGRRDWALWRLPSFVSGLLIVGILAWDETDPAAGLLAAALAAGSAVMALYSTEARGYAMMTLCAVACRRLLASRDPLRPATAAAFAAVAALGFFAHPIFLFVLSAAFAWAWFKLPRERRAVGLLVLFGPAAAAGLAFELLQRGPLRIGGGALYPFGPVVFRALAQWSGAPDAGPAAFAGAAALAALCGWELLRLRRARDAEFAFLAALAVQIAVFVAILPFRYERYFFVFLPFALMLAARALMRLLRRGPGAKASACALIGLYFLGGAVRIRALDTAGRGHYLEAVRRMAADTDGPDIYVASDHPFRNPLVLTFYADYLPPGKRMIYVSAERAQVAPPEWYLRHTFDADPRTAPVGLEYAGKASYRLAGYYPYAGMSGWTWLLYRRTSAGRVPE